MRMDPVKEEYPLVEQLEDNVRRIRQGVGDSADIKFRGVHIDAGSCGPVSMTIIYVDGMSNLQRMLHAILNDEAFRRQKLSSPDDVLAFCKASVIAEGEVSDITTLDRLFDMLLEGFSILLVDGSARALAIGTKELKARSVEEPNVQAVVRGPREGFSEVLVWNTAMLRRKINSRYMWIETMKIGEVTQTDVALVYIENIASKQLVEEARRRLQAIETDSVLESNYIEEFLQDHRYSPFPTIFNTERPDVVAAGLLEGRIAILVDGTPFALMAPALFVQFFQSSEDYYQRSDFASMIRLLRFLSFLLACVTPAVYIAISTFHQEMLPTTLLYNLASQREGVPFPAFVEAIMMEVTFEILREASVRMPKSVGQAISIVGTLVVGQAAVEAGLVSAAMVIVVSITAISNFVIPSFNMGISVRIIRFCLMILAASFGLYGIFMGGIVLTLHLCTLTSLGVPYMSPIAPFRLTDQQDTLVRSSMYSMFKRPSSLNPNRNNRRKKRSAT